jgi:hypothetical protein
MPALWYLIEPYIPSPRQLLLLKPCYQSKEYTSSLLLGLHRFREQAKIKQIAALTVALAQAMKLPRLG